MKCQNLQSVKNKKYFNVSSAENRIPLKPGQGEWGGGGEGGGGGVCSLANYSVAYEATQSNRVSDFFFVILCVLCFQKQSFLTFTLLYCSWCCAVWQP